MVIIIKKNKIASFVKNIKELYDAGVLSDEEYKEEKNKIMNTRKKLDDEEVVKIEPQQVAIIAKRKLTGKYVSGDVSIIIENESFFIIKNKGLVINQGRVVEEGNNIVFRTKENKKKTFTRQGANLVTLKGVVYQKQYAE